MRIIDDQILAALKVAVPPVDVDGDGNLEDRVHDGFVPVADTDSNVITAALPYVAYFSSLGDDSNWRLAGYKARRSMFFQVTYVGASRAQAKWAGERQRAALADKVVTIPGRRSWRVLLGESQRIRRDDDAARPDGSPLFYGVDLYSLAVTRSPGE